jgi:hypothetical protein
MMCSIGDRHRGYYLTRVAPPPMRRTSEEATDAIPTPPKNGESFCDLKGLALNE